MILLCGIPSEPPLDLVAKGLDANGAPYAIFNQRQFATTAMSFEISAWMFVASPLSEAMA